MVMDKLLPTCLVWMLLPIGSLSRKGNIWHTIHANYPVSLVCARHSMWILMHLILDYTTNALLSNTSNNPKTIQFCLGFPYLNKVLRSTVKHQQNPYTTTTDAARVENEHKSWLKTQHVALIQKVQHKPLCSLQTSNANVTFENPLWMFLNPGFFYLLLFPGLKLKNAELDLGIGPWLPSI